MVNVSVDDLQVLYILSLDPHLHQFLSGSGSGFGQPVQFPSGNPPLASSQNRPISIWKCYGFSKKIENFYPDWDLGSKGTFRGPCKADVMAVCYCRADVMIVTSFRPAPTAWCSLMLGCASGASHSLLRACLDPLVHMFNPTSNTHVLFQFQYTFFIPIIKLHLSHAYF